MGTDRVLVYARFDDSTKDFPIDTKFAQIDLVKNPTSIGSTSIFLGSQYSSLNSFKFSSTTGTPAIGEKISQTTGSGVAVGYVASFDSETKVMKYFQDRSLYFNQTTADQTDYIGISTSGRVWHLNHLQVRFPHLVDLLDRLIQTSVLELQLSITRVLVLVLSLQTDLPLLR